MREITNKLAKFWTHWIGKCFACLPNAGMAHDAAKETSPEPLLALLDKSSTTRQFAALLKTLPGFCESFNDPRLEWTIWAPTDEVMRKIEDEMHQMPLDELKRIVSCLISPHCFPSKTLYYFPNVPLLHEPTNLNGRQLLRVRPTFLDDVGPTFVLNFGAHVIHPDIVASNGIIHIIDNFPRELIPVAELLESLPPASFNVLQRAIRLTGFQHEIAEHLTQGCTFFAPTNAAFAGAKIVTFEDLLTMQSTGGLLDLLRGHFCPNQTLYSNILYNGPRRTKEQRNPASAASMGFPVPAGHRVFLLRTMRKGTNLSVSIDRYAGAIHMAINGRASVISSDHLAVNGVVHIIDHLVVQVRSEDGGGVIVINSKEG